MLVVYCGYSTTQLGQLVEMRCKHAKSLGGHSNVPESKMTKRNKQ